MQRATIIKLLDTNKAKFAFLAPLVTAVGSSVASWIITGNFNEAELRTALGGAVLASVSGITTYLVPAKKALVEKN